ncbi:hypothetical protein N1851_001364 [Merluccius polli]|uniref:Alkylated DNA repair protein AlkB homologue 8 N-terminal domain-containing protein n=1 Tax=Merluccius polli TaxID=89951 RepID=A0AA47NBP8_MERPO|nr:hypothetical protein N1851_001364 [Merluccius polli]
MWVPRNLKLETRSTAMPLMWMGVCVSPFSFLKSTMSSLVLLVLRSKLFKTKELIVDFRKEKGETHTPIHINGMAVERVSSFKFLGTHISETLTWTINTSSLVKKANQRLFFLRTLKKNHLSADILCNFYRCAIESILTNCITAWYGNCTVADRKSLQRVVKAAQHITRTPLPTIEVVQKKRCLNRARSILRDLSHPAYRLFQLLPSGRRYRCLQTKTSRFRNSFFPTAVSLLNSVPR